MYGQLRYRSFLRQGSIEQSLSFVHFRDRKTFSEGPHQRTQSAAAGSQVICKLFETDLCPGRNFQEVEVAYIIISEMAALAWLHWLNTY